MDSVYPDELFPRPKAALLTSYKVTITTQDYNVDVPLSQKTNVPWAVELSGE